ncbi:MAG: Transcriptional regulator, LacI family [Microbacteriaceae bacterium]|jgi:LacI family transcriptional regulator|nr:Transcriptional regulator, LacI family [Microbacteriaceae bacterium]
MKQSPKMREPQPSAAPVITIRDVADAAKTSVGTVSNVLNRPSVVAPATRSRVQDAIAELGFVRHAGAALMRGGRARTIGLIVLDIANPFFTELARGAEAAARERDHLVILCNSDEDPAQEQRYFEALAEQRVLGVLVSPVDERSSTIDWMRERGTAVVLLERSRPDYCSVQADDISGGELAADHLLDLGHRHLVYVTGSLAIGQYGNRLAGVRRALSRRGLGDEALEILEYGSTGTMKEGGQAAADILDRQSGATGIVCANDLLALGVVGALARAGVSVPGEFSIVGYDDIELAEQNALPLTTIRQHKHRMGFAAAQLIIDEAENSVQHTHQQIVFQPELIVRMTTAIHESGS